MIPKIAPSILAADFAALGDAIHAVEQAGVDWIHVDVMDGHFVPNISIGVPVVKSIRPVTDLPLDVHLMIANPADYITPFAEAGADYLTVHIEVAQDAPALLNQIRAAGCKAGIALNPETDITTLTDAIPHADLVLVMSVHPGFGGQSFMPEALPKLRKLRAMIEATNPGCALSVDGGVGPQNAGDCIAAGANVLVAGSAIFKAEAGIQVAVDQLRGEG